MTARLLRAVTRPLKRLLRPLRIAHLNYLAKHSQHQVQRLREMRADLIQLERIEHFNLVQLEVRRQQIEKGLA